MRTASLTIARLTAGAHSLLLVLLLLHGVPQIRLDAGDDATLVVSALVANPEHGALAKREGLRLSLAADHGQRGKARLFDPPDTALSPTAFAGFSQFADSRPSISVQPAVADSQFTAFQPRAPPVRRLPVII